MSGIYIPGIETSKTCAFCQFCDGLADTQLGACAYCVVDGKAREADTTPKDCPLIPVPDHGRCIDALWVREQIIKQWMDHSDESHMYKRGMEDAYEVIRNAPTIISASGGEQG